MIEFSLAGSYRNFKLIQNNNEIDLYNNTTGHRKKFFRVVNLHSTTCTLSSNSISYNENKRVKAFLKRKWSLFYNERTMIGRTLDEITTDYLLYVSKSIRDLKLEDLLE